MIMDVCKFLSLQPPATEPEPFQRQPKRHAGIPDQFLTYVDDPNLPGAKLTNKGRYAVPTIAK